MKIKIALILALSLAVFLLWRGNREINNLKKQFGYIRLADSTSSDILNIKGKVDFTFRGADGIPYYFSISDTVPDLPYNIPHILLSQGDPLFLHSVLALDNNTRTGDDSLNAIIGVVDNKGNTNNVLRATPNEIGIQTTQAGDSSRGAYYGFTKNGIDCRRGEGNDFSRSFILTNHRGLAGQVLTINVTGDTALWANPAASSAVTQKYFMPGNGQTVSIIKSAYNIINPALPLSSLAIDLPKSAMDNDWFEITFTQNIKTITYTGGKVAGNAIKTASSNSNYKKFVFRKADLTWY